MKVIGNCERCGKVIREGVKHVSLGYSVEAKNGLIATVESAHEIGIYCLGCFQKLDFKSISITENNGIVNKIPVLESN